MAEQQVARMLRRRVRAAITEASSTVARSECLSAARILVRDPHRLARRCAWCGRLALGRHWTPPAELPGFLPAEVRQRISHGICPDCLARLEREGGTRPTTGRRSAMKA
jgi:hypothetical protein